MMEKRSNWWLRFPDEPITLELEALLDADAGMGVSDAVVDRAFWLADPDSGEPITPIEEEWITAIEAVDKRGDKIPLVALLKSQSDLSPEVRFYLADLLERNELKKPPHRPRTPAYDRTAADAALEWAVQRVRDYRSGGMGIERALERVSTEHSIPLEILGNAYEGKRGSTNRARRRSRL
jgi:hypothetical protein